MTRRIAIVEDEAAIRENYATVFRKYGYDVAAFEDRASAMSRFRIRLPDLVILDIGLGDEAEGGFEMCRELRAMSRSLPIVFLTARDSDLDSISGLRLGADDYLTKDISLPHMLARVAALFRRVEALKGTLDEEDVLTEGELVIDCNRLTAAWRTRPLPLTLTEFWILHALVRRPGHVKSREHLMEDASIVVDDTTVTSHVKRIRKKFREIDQGFEFIETVYGMGYRWSDDHSE